MSVQRTSTATQFSRRQFLVGTAAVGAGLTIAFRVPGLRAQTDPKAGAALNPFPAYIRIGTDNTVTVFSAHMDMGQGCYHGIATLVAEELDAAWAQLRVEGGAGNVQAYGNLAWGGMAQGTGGSTAMASSFTRYRQAGAMARAMLVAAAAKVWQVPSSAISVSQGTLSHPSGKRATFGQLADAAAREALPASVTLKAPAQWTVIGSEQFRRLDSAAKSTGQQAFTIDVQLPGMLTAVVARPLLFGAKVKAIDATRAKAVPGVVDVVQISRGVAVVADNTWAALKGREALLVTWDESAAEKRGTAAIMEEYRAMAEQPGALVAVNRGDIDAALGKAARVIEARYEFPYLVHAAMEPLDAVVRRDGDVIEMWGGHQLPDLYQAVAAQIANLTPGQVRMHVMKTGGSFGRRAVADADVIVEAVETAKALGWRAPVKLLWTREDDMRGGRYRPMMLHRARIGLDAAGKIVGWQHRIVGQSILIGTPFESMLVKDGLDATSVEGVFDTPYALSNFRTEVTNTTVGVPVLWWRSVGHAHAAYVMETLLDEIAAASGTDPVALRRDLLQKHPRHLAVLNLVAEKAKWNTPLPAGSFRGIAIHESFSTVVAQVVEITVASNNRVKVQRVVCAVDCGTVINPDQVRAQLEGGIGFGLGAILHEELTLNDGRVVQTNYSTYAPLRMSEMPQVEVHIVPSTSPPTGVGEPGVPPVGPAFANAVAAALGKRVRILPFDRGLSV